MSFPGKTRAPQALFLALFVSSTVGAAEPLLPDNQTMTVLILIGLALIFLPFVAFYWISKKSKSGKHIISRTIALQALFYLLVFLLPYQRLPYSWRIHIASIGGINKKSVARLFRQRDVPELIAALKDPSEKTLIEEQLLTEMGKKTVPELMNALDFSDEHTRARAAMILGRIYYRKHFAIEGSMIKKIRSFIAPASSPYLTSAAIGFLVETDSHTSDDLSVILPTLSRTDGAELDAAMYLQGYANPDIERALPLAVTGRAHAEDMDKDLFIALIRHVCSIVPDAASKHPECKK